ncbi:hypothetical protein FXW78_01405 [Rhodococcus opacus]|nr:hypothetical protein [Rhodococcus opacus]
MTLGEHRQRSRAAITVLARAAQDPIWQRTKATRELSFTPAGVVHTPTTESSTSFPGLGEPTGALVQAEIGDAAARSPTRAGANNRPAAVRFVWAFAAIPHTDQTYDKSSACPGYAVPTEPVGA